MTASLEDYRVELDYYSGPLDLLLHLVKKHEIDLHDIPIATLTDQYMHHLEQMKQFDINVAADFLVMAATLLEIKAKMLSPRPDLDEAEGEPSDVGEALSDVDPRYELVQQLLAYKRFKDAANELEDRLHIWQNRFPHRPSRGESRLSGTGEAGADQGESAIDADAEAEVIELDLEDVGITDLCEAFARILEQIGQGKAVHAVTYDDTPIALHAEDIVDRLQREGPMKLQQIFIGRGTRSEMIGLFLATLELVRQKRVIVKQEKPGGDIELELRAGSEQHLPADDKPADWRNPETGEVEYDWPDEEAREHYEQRKQRALARLKGETDEEEEDYIELEEVDLELTPLAEDDDNLVGEAGEAATDEHADTEQAEAEQAKNEA